MENVSSYFSLGVTIVTAKSGSKINAMTASWAVPVSFRPPLVAVNIAPQRTTHAMIGESGKFVLNILAEDQKKLAEYIGSTSGRKTDKFKEGRIEYTPGAKTGVPVIEGCLASLECRVYDRIKAGDHTIFVGEVVNVVKPNKKKKPLLWHESGYKSLDGDL